MFLDAIQKVFFFQNQIFEKRFLRPLPNPGAVIKYLDMVGAQDERHPYEIELAVFTRPIRRNMGKRLAQVPSKLPSI